MAPPKTENDGRVGTSKNYIPKQTFETVRVTHILPKNKSPFVPKIRLQKHKCCLADHKFTSIMWGRAQILFIFTFFVASLQRSTGLNIPSSGHLKKRKASGARFVRGHTVILATNEESPRVNRGDEDVPPFPPRVDDVELLVGDLIVLIAAAELDTLIHIINSPNFEGWAAELTSPMKTSPGSLEDTFNLGYLLAACWLVGGAAADAWSWQAIDPGLGPRHITGVALKALAGSAAALVGVEVAAEALLPGTALANPSEIALALLLSAILTAGWRLLYSQRPSSSR